MNPPGRLLSATLSAVLLGLWLAACGAPAAARLGSPAPDFTLQTVDGTSVQLAQFKGKPVWINFWATWCVPCREEMPAMQELYDQYRDQGLVILAVNMEEDAPTVRRWIESGGYTFTFVLDDQGQQVKRYNVTAAPTSYFVGRDGIIRDQKLGQISRDEMVAKLDKLLSS
ncbi:MAG TPA: TlpA disulfide reductase family protein [Chloroflexota bacterium]|nr:TlpA disulfide reductase family protein [Chloroflexota bacterium]